MFTDRSLGIERQFIDSVKTPSEEPQGYRERVKDWPCLMRRDAASGGRGCAEAHPYNFCSKFTARLRKERSKASGPKGGTFETQDKPELQVFDQYVLESYDAPVI